MCPGRVTEQRLGAPHRHGDLTGDLDQGVISLEVCVRKLNIIIGEHDQVVKAHICAIGDLIIMPGIDKLIMIRVAAPEMIHGRIAWLNDKS